MPLPSDCYDPETLALMARAVDAACHKIVTRDQEADRAGLHTIMEIRIMAAVRNGERDPVRLTQLALEATTKH
jgi:hypothetical protein